VSIIIIAVLFSLASFSCNVGALLVNQQSYTNLFTLANAYLGSLLFTNGVSLLSSFYQTSLNFVIASNVVLFVTQTASQFASALFSAVSVGGIVSLKPGGAIEFVLMSYSGMVTGTYSGLMVVAFAPLYLLFLILPVIKAGALAVVVPVALLIRSLSFVGPKLREASNLFLALAIGFYFVLPLTIVFNIYVASCLHIGLVSSINMPSCRGYDRWTQYLTPYVLPITTSNLFSSTGQSLTTGSSIPLVGNINLLSAYGFNLANPIPGLAGGATSVWNTVWSAPQIAADQATKIAVYLFLGVLMLGLDLAVTAGFINGLGKGLNALANIFGLESFWGD